MSDKVRERGIIMAADSVRAILAGRKTQTRRVVTTPIPAHRPEVFAWFAPSIAENKAQEGLWCRNESGTPEFLARCPYGAPGDRLWVKEAWQYVDQDGEACNELRGRMGGAAPFLGVQGTRSITWRAVYRADGPVTHPKHGPLMWRSPMFMPRWASRLTLEVVEVRVQRVQEISEADAQAEGMEITVRENGAYEPFRQGWNSLNAKRGFPWASNPWVWAVTFKRVEAV